MRRPTSPLDALEACHGYTVVAADGVVGEVETPLFLRSSSDPDFLLLRVHRHGRLFPSYVPLPVTLVHSVDESARRLLVDGAKQDVERHSTSLVARPLGSAPAGDGGSPDARAPVLTA
jgi:hypothetical protein